MNNFQFYAPTKVYFGKGQLEQLNKAVNEYGKRVLLVYGGGSIIKNGIYRAVCEQLKAYQVFELANVNPNPRIESVREGVNLCKKEAIDVIVAVGGGSCIDCSKAIAAGAYYEHDPWDLILDSSKINGSIPIITVLTLSATGSEMNNSGVISNWKYNLKLGFSDQSLFPKVSILDPTYTFSVPFQQTAAGTADIISHLFEIYFNGTKGAYVQEEFAHALLKTCFKYGKIALDNPYDYDARANLMWAASMALNGSVGSGFAKSWSCHPMEHVLSAYYDLTHGVGLAILTPKWMRYILDDTTVSRLCLYGIQVWGIDPSLDAYTIANKAIDKTEAYFTDVLKIPASLHEVGIDDRKFEEMAQSAVDSKGGIIKGFKHLYKEDVLKIYQMCR